VTHGLVGKLCSCLLILCFWNSLDTTSKHVSSWTPPCAIQSKKRHYRLDWIYIYICVCGCVCVCDGKWKEGAVRYIRLPDWVRAASDLRAQNVHRLSTWLLTSLNVAEWEREREREREKVSSLHIFIFLLSTIYTSFKIQNLVLKTWNFEFVHSFFSAHYHNMFRLRWPLYALKLFRWNCHAFYTVVTLFNFMLQFRILKYSSVIVLADVQFWSTVLLSCWWMYSSEVQFCYRVVGSAQH
jgi:hypothetical protein